MLANLKVRDLMMKKYTVLLLLLVFITGCSSTGMTKSERNAAYLAYVASHNIKPVDKISTFTYQGWQSLTDTFLILRTRIKDRYLIQLNNYCPDLSFAQAIAINQSMGSILTTKFDSISVIGSQQTPCYIKAIYPLTKDQAEEIARLGKSQDEHKEDNTQDK
jgi:hypothetical protein